MAPLLSGDVMLGPSLDTGMRRSSPQHGDSRMIACSGDWRGLHKRQWVCLGRRDNLYGSSLEGAISIRLGIG